MTDKANSGVLGQGHLGLFRFGAPYSTAGTIFPIKIAAWKFGTIQGTAGVVRPAFFDNPLSLFDWCNFDVTAIGSSIGVTETVPVAFVTSATVVIPKSFQQSGQPTQVSASMNVV